MQNPSDTAVLLLWFCVARLLLSQLWSSRPFADISVLTIDFLTQENNKSNKNKQLRGLFHKSLGKEV
jgi:hypothetical protein